MARALGNSQHQGLISSQTPSQGRDFTAARQDTAGQEPAAPWMKFFPLCIHGGGFALVTCVIRQAIWWLDKAERRGKVRWWSEKMIAAGTSQPKALGHLTHLPLILSTDSTQRAGESPFPKPQVGCSSSKCKEESGSHWWLTAKLAGTSKNSSKIKSHTRSLSALSDNRIFALGSGADLLLQKSLKVTRRVCL